MADNGLTLTDEQHAAVVEDGNVCLVACPGSGKTRTVVAKILHAIEDVRNTPRRVGAITYTNAAVDEIEVRLRAYGSSDDHGYYEVSTIHSFCLSNILSPFHYLLPQFRDGFSVVTSDDDEWEALVGHYLDQYQLADFAGDKFDQIHRRATGEVVPPRDIPLAAAQEFVQTFEERAWVSFSDIVYHSACLVRAQRFIPSALASRFRWLIVDEFQDTSDTQVAILEAVADWRRTGFFFVGDPNQSIMSFAGASPSLISSFAGTVGARIDMRLTGNHRSCPSIVGHAERLCPTCPAMRAVGQWRSYDVSPEYHECQTAFAGICEHFLPRLRDLQLEIGSAAILAPWWLPLYHLSRKLREAGVRVIGPGARPYKRLNDIALLAEHMCAYLASPTGTRLMKLQRALFITILRINGAPEWKVYGYDGRVLLFRLVGMARELAREHDRIIDWLPRVAEVASGLLSQADLLSKDGASSLEASAATILAEMRRNKVDPATARLEQLGVYAVPEESMQLMTMHAAKGREFDAVALVDLHVGRLPHFSSRGCEEVAEARRVLYVGVTRAQKLLMYFTDRSDWRNTPSPFLGPEGLHLTG